MTKDETLLDDEFVEDEANSEELNTGIVTGCVCLNVRQEPSVNSTVLCTVPVTTKLMVDVKKSNLSWFHVYTESGIEGFCMKRFVNVK